MKKSFIIFTLVVMGLVGVTSCSQTEIPEIKESSENIMPANKD